MRVGKYETGIFKALKDRIIPPGSKHPRRAFWWSTEGWIEMSDPRARAALINDDELGINRESNEIGKQNV